MPIECNVYASGGDIQRQARIEPGTASTYLYYIGEIGKAMLACCHLQDRGGRVYFLEQENLGEILDEEGNYDLKRLSRFNYEPIPPGETVPIEPMKDGDVIFIFTHNSPN